MREGRLRLAAPPLGAAANAALAGIAKSAANAKPADRTKSAAQDFEAVFLNTLFQQMFSNIGKGPFGGGSAAGVWRSLLTDEYAKSFAKAGGIGTGLFFVAGFMAAVVLILGSIGLALVLDIWLPVWASFFIIAGVYLLVAVIAVLVGIRLIKKVKAPTATISTAKEIPSAFKD